MPDFEDKIPISEFSYTNTLHNTDQAPIIQQDGADWDNFRTSMADIGLHINKDMEYVTDLHTTSKKIIGAINELADGGGGSADIISEASGAIATFNDGGDNIPVKSLITEIVATQSGTGTPSPSNVRSISGINAVGLSVTGKNLFDKNQTFTNGFINADGEEQANASYIHTDFIKAKAGVTYTTSGDVALQNTRNAVACYDVNRNFLERLAPDAAGGWTFTTPANTVFIRMNLGGAGRDLNTIQLEEGSTATTYEPFGTTHTITLPETIYGGELNCVGGSGEKTYGMIVFDGSSDENWSYASGNKWATITISDMMSGANQNGITNWLPKSTSYGTFGFALGRNNNNFYAYQIPDISGVTDLASWKTYLSNNPLQVVYPLNTSTTFLFTPEQITTLSGLNNIFSNTGDVEVEYFNENANQTSELIDAKQEFANYSSEEKVVGKWIDGSTLYEKTLYFNNVKLDKTDSTSELVHGVDNIGTTRFVAEVYFKFPNSGQDSWSPANNGLWNNEVYHFYWVVGETSIWILSQSGVYFDANPNRSYLVKIRYTKA